MIDRNRIIEGLITCDESTTCYNCTYFVEGQFCALPKDALELIETQDKRILELENIINNLTKIDCQDNLLRPIMLIDVH